MKRRDFFQSSTLAGLAAGALGLSSCKDNSITSLNQGTGSKSDWDSGSRFFKVSLAQWSIHRMIREDGFDPFNFARVSSDWGFEGLEYVNQLYRDSLEPEGYTPAAMKKFVDRCNAESAKYGIPNLLIMVDGEGAMSDSDIEVRKQTIENHKKWVDAAADMGCHSIRVNLRGSEDPELWKAASADSLSRLSEYAKPKGINVLVENHGGLSSHGALLAEVIEAVGLDNCGTLPDFGNFCIESRKDENGRQCVESYDPYRGMRELLPYAKAVSAKSRRFNPEGEEIDIDFITMLLITRNAGFKGYIGVEYGGQGLTEEEGLLATKELLLRSAKELS